MEEGKPHKSTTHRYAWAGGGRKILRVDLTGDGGESWTQVLEFILNKLTLRTDHFGLG